MSLLPEPLGQGQAQTSPRRAGFRVGPFRAENEYYPTPAPATRALLAHLTLEGAIWEPACGEGWIAKELARAGYDVVATDIADYGYGTPCVDFLDQHLPRAKHIVTNPPYGDGLADAFIRKGLSFTERTGGTMAYLLNLASLCHPDRHGSFVRRPPSLVILLDECHCFPNGKPQQATRWSRTHKYCWAVWDATPATTTELRWASTAEFTDVAIAKRNAQLKKGNLR